VRKEYAKKRKEKAPSMNKNIRKLYELAEKEKRNIIGLMSGTSLDGLDIAYCVFTGSGRNTRVELKNFTTIPYPSELKEEIRKVFAKKTGDIEHLTLLNASLGILHGQWILDALAGWNISPEEADLVASHGQTIYHAPRINHPESKYGNATLQIGDGDHIAVTTGIITLSDFRQKHIAAGGEGAPLALYGDYLIFSGPENRLLLNMGGIANFTYLPASHATGEVLVTDTGPGNTLVDAWVQKQFGVPFDKDALLALKGSINIPLLEALKSHPFFQLPIPKTTGPELFNLQYLTRAQEESSTLSLDPHDITATLTKFSADTIAGALRDITRKSRVDKIYASGGGANNPFLMDLIREQFPSIGIEKTDVLGVPGDAKEAVLFAALANEAVAGEAIDFKGRDGMPSVTMGKISFPS
jgi:anhydro-N-acetylmuramic acid kinase